MVAILTAVAAPNLFGPMKGQAKLKADWSQFIDQLEIYRARAINSGKIYSVCPTVSGEITTIRAYFSPSGCDCSGGQWSTDAGESSDFSDVVVSTCANVGQNCVPVSPNSAPLCFHGDGHAEWASGTTGIVQMTSAKSSCDNRPNPFITGPNAPECYGEYATQVHMATGFFDKFQLDGTGQWIESR